MVCSKNYVLCQRIFPTDGYAHCRDHNKDRKKIGDREFSKEKVDLITLTNASSRSESPSDVTENTILAAPNPVEGDFGAKPRRRVEASLLIDMSDKEEGLELQEVVESREINGFKEMVNASNECGR